MPRLGDPEPLTTDHAVERFDCGRASLNQWLQRHALQAAAAGSARTDVTVDAQQSRVVGYHGLTAAGIEREAATARTTKGMPRYPILVVLLARLAIDSTVTGHGLGTIASEAPSVRVGEVWRVRARTSSPARASSLAAPRGQTD